MTPIPRYLEVALNLPLQQTFFYLDADKTTRQPTGCRVLVPFSGRKLTGFVIATSTSPPKEIKNNVVFKKALRIIDKEPIFTDAIMDMAHWLSNYYFCSLGQALSTIIPSGKRDVSRDNFEIPDSTQPLLRLTQEQTNALSKIKQGIQENSGGKYLLHGVTGSGKTEIYRYAAQEILDRGKQIIILVPEIALTPQTVSRFKALFPDKIALLHSRLTPSQRITEWRRIMREEAQVIIGARSAVFAPAPNLGMIIIDEEHENSYKASDCPRYHARQVAFFRTAKKGCLLLGSATPGFETLYHAKQGTIQYLQLKKRISPHPGPKLQVVNMSDEPAGALVSLQLLDALNNETNKGNQSLLFLNRRGFSPSLICKDCDKPLRCPHCSISLSFHKKKEILLCHYCGYTIRYKESCPECGSKKITVCGAGTERVEEFLQKRRLKIRLARIDSDTVAKKGTLFQLLNSFANKELDALVGTQMISKGLDFPDVTLVGVLSADMELNLPDFRSYERTFSQLLQVTGRCGRAEKEGTAYIQTLLPEEDPIQSVLSNDHDNFFEREMTRRKECNYPPFCRLIRIITRSHNKQSAQQAIENTTENLLKIAPANALLLGPAPCPIEKISANFRYNILLKAPNNSTLATWVKKAGLHEGTKGDTYYEIDVDPQNML